MQIRGVILVTLALFLGIAALVLHLLAVFSPNWKITKRDREPRMTPVSYGLWQRCEYNNITISKQGIAIGIRPVQVCYPNRYMRYAPEKYDTCDHIRRNCPVLQPADIPEGCSCRYLPSARCVQWLSILAAAFLTIGLLLLYLKTIASAQNESAVLVLSFGPFVSFVLASFFMVTTLIMIGAYLRRDAYEDYFFPLTKVPSDGKPLRNFDLHSLHNYAQKNKETFDHQHYLDAKAELLKESHDHYHTKIGWATGFEIIATVLTLIVAALTFILGTLSRSEEM